MCVGGVLTIDKSGPNIDLKTEVLRVAHTYTISQCKCTSAGQYITTNLR